MYDVAFSYTTFLIFGIGTLRVFEYTEKMRFQLLLWLLLFPFLEDAVSRRRSSFPDVNRRSLLVKVPALEGYPGQTTTYVIPYDQCLCCQKKVSSIFYLRSV